MQFNMRSSAYPLAALRVAVALVASALGLAASLSATPARAESYTFHQGGYAGGATVTGSFGGEDLDGDGWLFGYELTAFELHFSGNYAVPAFDHGLPELRGIAYRIGDSVIAGGEGRGYLSSSTYFPVLAPRLQGEDPYIITQFDSFGWPGYEIPGMASVYPDAVASMCFELIEVTPVPEPQGWALMAGGLGLLGVGLRRRGLRRAKSQGLAVLTPTRRPGPLAALQRWLARQRVH